MLVHEDGDEGWRTVSRKKSSKQTSSTAKPSKSTYCSKANVNINPSFDRLHERLTIPQARQLYEELKSRRGSDAIDPSPTFNPRQPVCNVLELKSHFDRVKRDWTSCTARSAVLSVLKTIAYTNPLKFLRKAVCLGLGSLSVEGSLFRKDSLCQLVVFMDIAQFLCAENQNGEIYLIAQDPVFNELDKTFLDELNIRVVESPTAFTEIDSQTFVFAPHYPVSWWTSSMRGGSIPLIIGNDVLKALDRFPDQEEVVEIFQQTIGASINIDPADANAKEELRRFAQSQESIGFPKPDMQEHAFVDTRIYWCPTTEELDSGANMCALHKSSRMD